MSLLSHLNQSALHERATRSVDAGGDAEITWSTVAAGVPCRIDSPRMRTRIEPVGEVVVTGTVGLFPGGTDLRPALGAHDTDRVTVDGITYRVQNAYSEGDGLFLVAELARMD